MSTLSLQSKWQKQLIKHKFTVLSHRYFPQLPDQLKIRLVAFDLTYRFSCSSYLMMAWPTFCEKESLSSFRDEEEVNQSADAAAAVAVRTRFDWDEDEDWDEVAVDEDW